MPKVTVYIRNEDIEKWKAVEEKTEFIHNALNRPGTTFMGEDIRAPATRKKINEYYKPAESINLGTFSSADEAVKAVKDKVWPDCPRHHVPMDRCRNRH